MLLKNIKRLCTEKNITVTELERILGFGNGTIHNWDERNPTLDKVLKIAKFFDVNVSSLVGEMDFSFRTLKFSKKYEELENDQKEIVDALIKGFNS